MSSTFKILFYGFVFCFIAKEANAQCAPCTKNLSGIVNEVDTILPGEVVCVESGAVLEDTVVMLGGQLCNMGEINGLMIVHDGDFNNYGQLYSDQNITLEIEEGIVQASVIYFSGSINNFGTLEVYNLATGIDSVTVVNNDSIIVNAWLHVKGDIENNQYIEGNQIAFDTQTNTSNQSYIYSKSNIVFMGELDNDGSIIADVNFSSRLKLINDSTIEIGGNATFEGNTENNSKISVGVNMANSGMFSNNDTLTAGQLANSDTILNYGFIDVPVQFGMSGQTPYFSNHNQLEVGDNFGMSGVFDNYGEVNVGGLFGIAGELRNNSDATFHVYDEAGSAGTIINHGEFNFEELFENDFNSSFENYGALHFKKNVSNKTSANFLNAGGMHVSGDFDNNGTFSTNCIINVLGDWENQFNGALFGSDTLVGGFAIQGYSSNLSDVAIDNSLFDICDAGSPVGYYDNIGFVAEEGEHVTYCLSNNYCTEQLVTSMNVIDEVQQVQIFPNPLQKGQELTIKNPGNLAWQILDVQGRTVSDSSIGLISTKNWEAGAYFLCLENGRVYKLIIK